MVPSKEKETPFEPTRRAFYLHALSQTARIPFIHTRAYTSAVYCRSLWPISIDQPRVRSKRPSSPSSGPLSRCIDRQVSGGRRSVSSSLLQHAGRGCRPRPHPEHGGWVARTVVACRAGWASSGQLAAPAEWGLERSLERPLRTLIRRAFIHPQITSGARYRGRSCTARPCRLNVLQTVHDVSSAHHHGRAVKERPRYLEPSMIWA